MNFQDIENDHLAIICMNADKETINNCLYEFGGNTELAKTKRKLFAEKLKKAAEQKLKNR